MNWKRGEKRKTFHEESQKRKTNISKDEVHEALGAPNVVMINFCLPLLLPVLTFCEEQRESIGICS
jgi:hypothetical protein